LEVDINNRFQSVPREDTRERSRHCANTSARHMHAQRACIPHERGLYVQAQRLCIRRGRTRKLTSFALS